MLKQFLESHREDILALGGEKMLELSQKGLSSPELKRGLPLFFEQLIEVLDGNDNVLSTTAIVSKAADHGKEMQRLGYTLSHVVHSYGAICQSVTEYAQKKGVNISSGDFNILNRCLDIAISAAVSEFDHRSVIASEGRELEHMGFLTHELRNALSSASVAFEMIQSGMVGTGGSTGKILAENLERMRKLIDRSLSDIRMRANPQLDIERYSLAILLDQLLSTARLSKRSNQIHLDFHADASIYLTGDRQLILSALANLIQNALKYSKEGSHIEVKAEVLEGQWVEIEVEDGCGGMEPKTMEKLFLPFTKGNLDQSGLGLGLNIVQRAVNLSQGSISVKNNAPQGCVFTLRLPLIFKPTPPRPTSVSGKDSVQPKAKNK